MKLGHVIGRVTLSQKEEAYKGGRFLLVQPLSGNQLKGGSLQPLAKGNSVVVYDHLGAGTGDIIAYSESGEASAPFDYPTPVDAYCAAIIDTITYEPPA